MTTSSRRDDLVSRQDDLISRRDDIISRRDDFISSRRLFISSRRDPGVYKTAHKAARTVLPMLSQRAGTADDPCDIGFIGFIVRSWHNGRSKQYIHLGLEYKQIVRMANHGIAINSRHLIG